MVYFWGAGVGQFPLALKAQEHGGGAQAMRAGLGLSVLLVDDDELIQNAVGAMLGAMGCP